MRFFTLDWWRGEVEGEPFADYAAHLATIRDRVPPDILVIEESVSLHDARLRELTCSFAEAWLSLGFDSADGQRLLAKYSGVRTVESTSNPLAGLPGPHGYGDLGYYEVDLLSNGTLEHRLLFSSGIELDIQFSGFRLLSW